MSNQRYMMRGVSAAKEDVHNAISPNHLLYDLIYNPQTTLFLQKGAQQGATVKNGQEMLELQAIAGWNFWTSE